MIQPMNCGRADRYKNKGKNRNRMKNKLAISMFGQKRLSREGGIEIVVKELCTRMARDGCAVTCYNRSGHHVSGAEYDQKTEYEGIRQKYVPTIEKKGLAAVSSSAFAALYSAFGKYDVVHIHAEGPAFFSWLPKLFGKKVVVTVHGIDWQREKWKSGFGSKFIRQGEKNAVKYADEIIVLSKGVQDYFKDTYGRKTHFIPNGVNRPEIRQAKLITEKFGLTKDSYVNTFMKMLNKLLKQHSLPEIKVGIGLSSAQELVVKAGRKGVGINSKIWIGKAVTRACHYANYGNKDGNPAIVFGSCSYNNMIDQLIKNDPDKNPKGWFTYHKDEGEGDYYTANIIKTGFDNWINSGMKID